ncbi:MAG: MBL fold metallo-hydrolase [Aggregatilineales bacterium]
MEIKWYGHASFRITAKDGTSIITDPYTPETAGYAPIDESADIVVISSGNDSFHCRADLIPGTPKVVNALELAQAGGEQVVAGISIRAIQAMEALDHRYHDPEQNALYRLTVDGLHIGHMGDVGNPLNADQMAFFADLDVLLALAGGHPTIALPDLYTVIEQTRPRLVIPMHFRTLRWKPRNTLWIESFLSLFDDEQVDFACDTQVSLDRTALPANTRILVLAHDR